MKQKKKVPQFKLEEFKRLLERIANGTDDFYHCSPSTVTLINRILTTQYSGKTDDLEYLVDMINCQMRMSGYTGPKSRYPISRPLDRLCQDPLYLNSN